MQEEISKIKVTNYGSAEEIVCINKLICVLKQRKDAGVRDIVSITP